MHFMHVLFKIKTKIYLPIMVIRIIFAENINNLSDIPTTI